MDDEAPCKSCGKTIVNPDDHYHGHTMESMQGPYCNQDCWLNSSNYDPEHGYKTKDKLDRKKSNDRAFHTGWSVVKEEPWAQCPNCDEIYTEEQLEELDAYFEEREMGSECFNCGYHAGRFTGRFNYE